MHHVLMNGFQKHKINYLSPSSVNLFQNAPSLWVAEKLYGFKGSFSPAAMRGTLIEKAIMDVIAHGRNEADAVADAEKEFNKKYALTLTDRTIAERDMIAPCVKLALAELAPYGTPDFKTIGEQNKIETTCRGPNWSISVIGYLDAVFEKHGLVVDVKSVSRMPSDMSANHKRQAAIYHKASGNKAVRFLYITPKKAELKEVENNAVVLADFKRIAIRMEKFLNLGDKELLRGVVHHDPESFYFNGATKETLALFS